MSASVIDITAQLFQPNVTRAAIADRDDKENWLAQNTDWEEQHLDYSSTHSTSLGPNKLAYDFLEINQSSCRWLTKYHHVSILRGIIIIVQYYVEKLAAVVLAVRVS